MTVSVIDRARTKSKLCVLGWLYIENFKYINAKSVMHWSRLGNLPPKFEIDCLSTCQLDANHSDAHLIQDFVFVPFDAPFASWKPFQSHFAATSDLRWRLRLCLPPQTTFD